MRYFIYCRKSQESEDRQVLSIESQLTTLKRGLANQADIEIVEVYEEAYSAKAPGRRIFEEMMARIEQKEAEGIIAWAPDRLARNSIDGGRIIYLLDRGILRDLKFSTYTFENNSQGKFMLSIMFGQSKYYSDSLSENVKRGNRTKLEKGWRPNRAPLGYRNHREKKTIILDSDRAALVRRMFDLALEGRHSLLEITSQARNWGLKTPEHRRVGGKYPTKSMVYRILTNPFYAGVLVWNGVTYPAAHEPLISVVEFESIQKHLRRRTWASPIRHIFPFTGLIRCGECGSGITAERKTNRFGSRYVYYHCTRKHINSTCKQPAIRGEALEAQFEDFIRSVAIKPRTHKWLVKQLRKNIAAETSKQLPQIQMIEKAISDLDRQHRTVTTMRLRELISDTEFVSERKRINGEREKLVQAKREAEVGESWIEPFETAILALTRAVDWFHEDDVDTKRTIIKSLGSNLTLSNKKLNIEAIFRELDGRKVGLRPSLCAVVDEFRTLMAKQDFAFLGALQVYRKMVARDNLTSRSKHPSSTAVPEGGAYEWPDRT